MSRRGSPGSPTPPSRAYSRRRTRPGPRAPGARRAGFVFLRLPGSVKQVFEERLRETLPLRADRVLNRVREARGGKLYDSRFGVRGRGEGNYAEAARALFDATVKRLGMNEGFQADTDGDTFRRPGRGRQLALL